MKTLIVPCAGRSSRFPNLKPKWMLYYPDGKIMLEKALEGLDLEEFDQVIITIIKEHVEKYQADTILEEIFGFSKSSKFKLCILEDYTSCQAETVYMTLQNQHVQGAIVVKDSDNYIQIKTGAYADFAVGININEFHREIRRLSGKSFFILNGQGIITDIIEKKIKSEYICVGMYGFGDAELFQHAYLHLKDISEKKYEIFLSHVISYLIGTKQAVYKYLEAVDYEDWGTIADWNIMLKDKKTVIINMDGLLFEKKERYGENGWVGQLVPIEVNIKEIRKLGQQGAQIIILTSMPNEYEEKIKKQLLELGIISYQVITGCNLSHKLLISSSDNTIPYPGCEAINVSVNSCLGEYM